MEKPIKPLKGKAYGSIPHLPGSRLGEGDHHAHQGQSDICLIKPRKGDRIIVQEKLDGACMSVANIDGELVALSRAGYKAKDALYEHLKMFDTWFEMNRSNFDFLKPGERLVGEWLAMAHGTIYDPDHFWFKPFVAFDLIRDGKRVIMDEFNNRVYLRLPRATTLHDSNSSYSIKRAMDRLDTSNGYHGAAEKVEGAIWRVENDKGVDFLAKYVRHDKQDGKYLPNISGKPAIWHWKPE